MKTTVLAVLCFTNSLYGMVLNSESRNMLASIDRGDVQQFKIQVDQICKPNSGSGSIQFLLGKHNINTNALAQFAASKEKEKEQDAQTCCNSSFFKNMALSLGCFSASAALTGFFIVVPITSGNFYPLQNGAGAGSAAGLLAALGIKHARCALTNSDAFNAYVKQLAIRLLLKKIRPQDRETV